MREDGGGGGGGGGEGGEGMLGLREDGMMCGGNGNKLDGWIEEILYAIVILEEASDYFVIAHQ